MDKVEHSLVVKSNEECTYSQFERAISTTFSILPTALMFGMMVIKVPYVGLVLINVGTLSSLVKEVIKYRHGLSSKDNFKKIAINYVTSLIFVYGVPYLVIKTLKK